MKKTLIALVLVTALLIVLSTTVLANGGPHGGYDATTDACAGCHRAHTAVGPGLLTETTTQTLCLSCHGTAGTGADTNVEDGFFLSTRSGSSLGEANTTDGNPLNAGGFTNYQGAATTSTHDVSGTVTDSWGIAARGALGTMAGGEALDCASCHDPHGSSNYRIIKETVNGVTVVVTQVDEGPTNKDYDDENWPANIGQVCRACHIEYHKIGIGQGSTPDAGTYTHRVDMAYTYGTNVNPETVGFGGSFLPLADSGAGDLVVCSTCHLSHGSSAAMVGFADGAGLPGETSATDSALLRLDNRGTCEVCHQK